MVFWVHMGGTIHDQTVDLSNIFRILQMKRLSEYKLVLLLMHYQCVEQGALEKMIQHEI